MVVGGGRGGGRLHCLYMQNLKKLLNQRNCFSDTCNRFLAPSLSKPGPINGVYYVFFTQISTLC